MALLALSLFAGVLTVLAPCVLPLLPIIVGGSVNDTSKYSRYKPLIIVGSFSASVMLFTLILQRLSTQFGLRPQTLTTISAIILIIFGIVLLFPNLWQKLMHITGIEKQTASLGMQKRS